MTVGADDPRYLPCVGATHDKQLDGVVVCRQVMRDAAAYGDGLDVHFGVAPNPHAEASIERVAGDCAQPGRPHAQREDARVP